MTTEPITWRELLSWTFGDRLRKIRRAANVDQEAFAAIIGEKRETLSKWEAGRVEPRNPVAVAKRIQMAYGIPASWTLGLETEESPRPSGPGDPVGTPPGTRTLNPLIKSRELVGVAA